MSEQPNEISMSSNAAVLTLGDAQALVDAWIKTVGVRYFSELTNTAVLMEEVGELARLIMLMRLTLINTT